MDCITLGDRHAYQDNSMGTQYQHLLRVRQQVAKIRQPLGMGLELWNRNCRVALPGRWHEQIDLQSGSPAFLKGRRVLATIYRGDLEKLDARLAQHVNER